MCPGNPEASRCITELLDALDGYIPDPKRATDRPFLMPIEGVHTIDGRGTVATGKVEQGVIAPGTKIEILGLGGVLETVVTSVEQFNRQLARAIAGQNVGFLLRGVKSDQIRRGQVVAALRVALSPNPLPWRGVRAGQGRRWAAHALLERLQAAVLLPHDEVTGELPLLEGVEMAMPGDHTPLNVSLDKPIALEAGSRFAIREGGNTVGSGVVTEVID